MVVLQCDKNLLRDDVDGYSNDIIWDTTSIYGEDKYHKNLFDKHVISLFTYLR